MVVTGFRSALAGAWQFVAQVNRATKLPDYSEIPPRMRSVVGVENEQKGAADMIEFLRELKNRFWFDELADHENRLRDL